MDSHITYVPLTWSCELTGVAHAVMLGQQPQLPHMPADKCLHFLCAEVYLRRGDGGGGGGGGGSNVTGT